MFALGQFAQDVLGTSTVFTGLACVPNTPAAMNVIVQPGAVYAQAVLDATAYSSLASDSTVTQKQGILKTAQTFATPAPVTSGQSIVYLISAAFLEADTNAVVLPYYNAANPSQAFSGPNGTGASQNTTRQDTVSLVLTAGVPATTGSQLTPATPVGQIALYTVTVAYGASTVVAGNIAKVAGAPFLAAPLLTQIQTAPNGVVGSARNVVMSVAAASASAALTADEIIVGTALGGQMFKLSSFSKTINLATTGAGGMDTGSAPTSGFVALYAIYNPTTGASALLATNAATLQGNVYGGANMPAGYTASALVGVWPTNSSKLFVVGYLLDRRVSISPNTILGTSTAQGSMTSLSISGVVPANARDVSGTVAITFTTTAGTQLAFAISGSATGIGQQPTATGGAAGTINTINGSFSNVPLVTAQTVYYTFSFAGGTGQSLVAQVNSYTF